MDGLSLLQNSTIMLIFRALVGKAVGFRLFRARRVALPCRFFRLTIVDFCAIMEL